MSKTQSNQPSNYFADNFLFTFKHNEPSLITLIRFIRFPITLIRFIRFPSSLWIRFLSTTIEPLIWESNSLLKVIWSEIKFGPILMLQELLNYRSCCSTQNVGWLQPSRSVICQQISYSSSSYPERRFRVEAAILHTRETETLLWVIPRASYGPSGEVRGSYICYQSQWSSWGLPILQALKDSLAGEASHCLKQLPPGSLTSSAGIKNAFLCNFFDEARTEDLKSKIATFTQEPTESFRSFWIRFKSYQRDFPHHGLNEVQLLSTFVMGIAVQYQMALDASCGNRNSHCRFTFKLGN